MKLFNRPHSKPKGAYKSGYFVLDAAEALLDAATKDPGEFPEGWYLKKLMILERLIDNFSPGRYEVGRRKSVEYRKRKDIIRQRIDDYAASLDQELVQKILPKMKKVNEEIADLPNRLHTGNEEYAIDKTVEDYISRMGSGRIGVPIGPVKVGWLKDLGIKGSSKELERLARIAAAELELRVGRAINLRMNDKQQAKFDTLETDEEKQMFISEVYPDRALLVSEYWLALYREIQEDDDKVALIESWELKSD